MDQHGRHHARACRRRSILFRRTFDVRSVSSHPYLQGVENTRPKRPSFASTKDACVLPAPDPIPIYTFDDPTLQEVRFSRPKRPSFLLQRKTSLSCNRRTLPLVHLNPQEVAKWCPNRPNRFWTGLRRGYSHLVCSGAGWVYFVFHYPSPSDEDERPQTGVQNFLRPCQRRRKRRR